MIIHYPRIIQILSHFLKFIYIIPFSLSSSKFALSQIHVFYHPKLYITLGSNFVHKVESMFDFLRFMHYPMS